MMDASATSAWSSTRPWSPVARLAPLRQVVLAALFVAVGFVQPSRLPALASPDIWRHLSVGSWILDNRSIPHHIVFDQSSELSWSDSSWFFDVLTAFAVKVLGLRGLPFLGTALAFAIAIALFLLARGVRRGFWSAGALKAIALDLLAGLPLRSSVASVVLFAVVLKLIADSQSTNAQRNFYFLPPLFLLWTNLDIQFVYGLMALALFSMAEAITNLTVSRNLGRQNSRIPLPITLIVTATSFAATLCNPYGYHLWGVALRSVSHFAADPYIAEMHALRFRQPHDYVLLLLIMTAFFAIGRRHARDVYATMLLTACSIISFHLQRDAWLVTIAAVAVLSQLKDASHDNETHSFESATPWWVFRASMIAAFVILI